MDGEAQENSVESSAPVGEVIRPAYQRGLTPWRKGQTGNPRGRPVKTPLTDALRKQLGKRVPAETVANLLKSAPTLTAVIGKAPRYADLLAFSMIQQGVKGNIQAAARIFDRVEGRIPKEIIMGDQDRLDELMHALELAPAAPGEVNE